ncbi:TetR/AcrR family transcriptional regulator [Thermicanus aegyptius]|uniref:TetR/AcrR family transcriptional regulator n=1 Tax=Thermicanus aegyptius TaxID=94009 RepID=UPI00040736FC|nr:TetR/AcrR family transcriptional regulator [Thermicanus aegyptius]
MSRRAGDKYDTIIRAAIRVFATHGYHNAQVSKIAREANVADGTIYLYFESKADVLISLFQETMGLYVEKLKEKLALIDDPEEQLRLLIHSHFESLAHDKDLAIVTQIELRQSDPEIRRGLAPILKKYLDVIDGIIERGKEKGVFRREVITHVARKMIFGTLDETVTSWVMANTERDLMNLVEPVQDLLIHGLR